MFLIVNFDVNRKTSWFTHRLIEVNEAAVKNVMHEFF
jgi:hypothetical protein